MLLKTILIIGIFYIGILALITIRTRTKEKNTINYLLGGSNLGAVLGFFTFAATLFSTFTLLGMPDFFRTHGVGAWIFLAVSDAFMVFGIISIGYAFRKKIKLKGNFSGMAGFLKDNYQTPWAGYIYFIGAFLFLIPYVAIQIRGVAIFLHGAFPESIPLWGWAFVIVTIMLLYSEIGGLKAIFYSDALQGVVLLVAIWIVAIYCIKNMGGLSSMFEQVSASNEKLLSTPGPNGLINFQFLLGSAAAIFLLPYTQPQISTRLAIMRNNRSLFRMAVGVGIFALVIILPTLFIGMYGSVLYSDANTPEFLSNALINDQITAVAAIVIIGLVAAAISTSDSQIFALGGEVRSLLTGDEKKLILIARICITLFAGIALVFALLSSDQLVLLARTSFAGTAIMAPMIFLGVFYPQANQLKWFPILTFVSILVFVASLLGLIPSTVVGFRLDLFLLILLSLIAVVARYLK